jgi:hypothetical protein
MNHYCLCGRKYATFGGYDGYNAVKLRSRAVNAEIPNRASFIDPNPAITRAMASADGSPYFFILPWILPTKYVLVPGILTPVGPVAAAVDYTI